MKSLSLLVGSLVALEQGASAQCACDYTIPVDTLSVNGIDLGVQPGQTVCVDPGGSAIRCGHSFRRRAVVGRSGGEAGRGPLPAEGCP